MSARISAKTYAVQTFKYHSAFLHINIHYHGAVCILVQIDMDGQIQFQADLQAIAVCITIINETFTVASVYVPPSKSLNELAFDNDKEFPLNYLILQEFNGHSNLWGASQDNDHGKCWTFNR